MSEAPRKLCDTIPHRYMVDLSVEAALEPAITVPRSNQERSLEVLKRTVGPFFIEQNTVDKLAGTDNYFIGNDPSRWHRGIPTYRKVHYSAIYPGIDLVYYGNQRQLEYDFVVSPGADPHRIRIRFDGSQRLSIDDGGDRFIADENLLGIKERKPGERATDKDELAYSIATSYLSLCNCIREKWGKTKLDNFKPLAFQQWLKNVDKKPKTKGHLKAFVHRLFNKAKLYEMVTFVENPIKLVEVRGISKRHKKQVDLTTEQCFIVFGLLPEPYNKMAFTALCTGLRIEEILALDWKKIDFLRLCMKVEEAVVHGRLGPVKTEYSQDELPLEP